MINHIIKLTYLQHRMKKKMLPHRVPGCFFHSEFYNSTIIQVWNTIIDEISVDFLIHPNIYVNVVYSEIYLTWPTKLCSSYITSNKTTCNIFLLLKHINMVDHDLINNIFIYRSSGRNSPSMASSFTISILWTTTKPMYVTKTNSSFSFVSFSVFL